MERIFFMNDIIVLEACPPVNSYMNPTFKNYVV
jgi:hypothetical protein